MEIFISEKLFREFSCASDVELLSAIIDDLETAKALMHKAEYDLGKVYRMNLEELSLILERRKAIAIRAAFELGRRRMFQKAIKVDKISSSSDISKICMPILMDLPYEEMWVGYVSVDGKLLTIKKIGQGGIAFCAVDVRLIFKPAIEMLAAGIFICHNHPSGNKKPSYEDDKLTEKTKASAKILDILFLDHIIIAGNDYYSYADEGRVI